MPGSLGFFARDPRMVSALRSIAGGNLSQTDVSANHGMLDMDPAALVGSGQSYDQRRRDAYFQGQQANESDPHRQQMLRIEEQTANQRAAAQPDWSAFFGRTGAEGDEAHQAGYNFSTNLGGQPPRRPSGAASLYSIGGR